MKIQPWVDLLHSILGTVGTKVWDAFLEDKEAEEKEREEDIQCFVLSFHFLSTRKHFLLTALSSVKSQPFSQLSLLEQHQVHEGSFPSLPYEVHIHVLTSPARQWARLSHASLSMKNYPYGLRPRLKTSSSYSNYEFYSKTQCLKEKSGECTLKSGFSIPPGNSRFGNTGHIPTYQESCPLFLSQVLSQFYLFIYLRHKKRHIQMDRDFPVLQQQGMGPGKAWSLEISPGLLYE